MRKIINFSFVIFFLIALNNISYGQKETLTLADSLLTQKNFIEAIKNYQLIIKQSPNYEPAWFGLQTAYIQSGNFSSGQNIKNIFSSDRLLWGQIRILFYSNKFDSVPVYMVELVRRFPNSAFVNNALELGILQTELGDDTINLKKYAMAQFNYETQNYTEGINAVQEIIVKSGTIAEYGYLLLSRLFSAKKEFNQAIATLNEFTMKFPSGKFIAKARYELGLIYLESVKDTMMAKNVFEDLISNYPASPESYFARSKITILGEIKSKEVPK